MKIKYDCDIYAKKTIIRATNDYTKIAKINVKTKGHYIECSFLNCVYGEEITMKRFSNYLIDCMNQDSKYDN